MRLHHYSIRTEKSYWYWVRNFIFFNQLLHPQKLGAIEVNAFLTLLVCFFRQGYRPWVSAPSSLLFTREVATIASMTCSREMDCRLAILRGRIETWKEAVDRNLSWFNQLGKTVAQVSSRIRRECGNTLTPALSQGERGLVHCCTVASGGHGFEPPLIR